MTTTSGFVIKVVHRRVSRYLKRQEKRIQQAFWEALDHICRGPFPKDDPVHITHLKGPLHCSYRYALGKGKQSQRIKYDVDVVSREITVYDLGPRGDAYKTQR